MPATVDIAERSLHTYICVYAYVCLGKYMPWLHMYISFKTVFLIMFKIPTTVIKHNASLQSYLKLIWCLFLEFSIQCF